MYRLCASLLLLLVSVTALAQPLPEPPPAAAPGPPAEPEPEPEPAPSVTAPEVAQQLLQSDGSDGSLTLKEATERGIRLFKEGSYDGAIQAFTAAYVLSPKPMFLFNIAQAHRKAGRPQDALLSYQLFLRKAPETPLRAETEAYMELVRTQLQARPPEPVKPEVHAVQPDPPPRKAEPRGPMYRRPWPWIVLGAAVAITAGVAVGVYLGTRPPPTTLGIVEPTFF